MTSIVSYDSGRQSSLYQYLLPEWYKYWSTSCYRHHRLIAVEIWLNNYHLQKRSAIKTAVQCAHVVDTHATETRYGRFRDRRRQTAGSMYVLVRERGSYLVPRVDQTLHGTKQRAVRADRDDDLIHGINVM